MNHIFKNSDLSKLSGQELVSDFAAKTISPVEATKAALTRAISTNGTLNAFSEISEERALNAAKASEKRWQTGTPLSPIDGLPTTIKEIVHCHGHDVRYGSLTTEDVSALPDSPSVKKLRDAGAVIIGLTNTPEFGWKAVTDNPRRGITRNPWDTSKTPGGSSGGASAAAAVGAGTLHLGTDGGGSIRIPSSFTGIVGLKPSFGRVPANPPSAFGTVAHIGPMARTTEDCALMFNAMSGRDTRDWNQPMAGHGACIPKSFDWKDRKIAYWKRPPVGAVNIEVATAVERVLDDLSRQGAEVKEIELPHRESLLEVFCCHWYGGAATKISSIEANRHVHIDKGLLEIAEQGRNYSGTEIMQAQIARAEFGSEMDHLLEQYDFLISPTVAVLPFEAGSNTPKDTDYRSWIEWASFSFPINLSQQPACSVPCAFSASGLPIGLQIVGPRWGDEKVLSAAMTIQEMYPDQSICKGGRWPEPTV